MAQEELGSFSADSSDVAEARAVAGGTEEVSDSTGAQSGDDALSQDTIDLAVTQINYLVEGSGEEEYPVITVFGRTASGEVVQVRVRDFKPYFYVPRDSVTESDLSEFDQVIGWEETNRTGEPYVSIRGERLLKVFARTPRDVGQIRDQFTHYEADILFPNRFLIDKDITSGIRVPEHRTDAGVIEVSHEAVEPVEMTAELRVCTFDIEVDDRAGFPEDGEEEIVCISSHDSYRDEYVAWLSVSGSGNGESLSTLSNYDFLTGAGSIDVRAFSSEEAMLASFLDYIEETDPDVLTGWNFADFDAPYLLDRLERLEGPPEFDLDYNRLSRVNEVWRSDWQGPNIKGRVVFDLLYAYQRTQFSELDSYRLDAVAEQELGAGKERYTGNLGDLWESDPEQLLEYNLRDVELCVEIDQKQAIIPFWQEVASFVGCKLEDATTPGDAVDMYVLHKAHSEFVLPSKGQQDGEEFEGGAVFDPVTGVREMVTVLDLKSLYPMCMVTINASPETKVDADYSGETYEAPNGQCFRKEPDGMIREMVEELLAEREEKKELRDGYSPDSTDFHLYDRQQSAVKVIMNCFTPDTEVLTPDGVRNITDLEEGDEVYSLDPETMEMQVKPVVETHAYPDYDGNLVDIQTSKMDFRVTPNHRMLVRKNEPNGISWNENDYRFVEAGELDWATNYELPHDWSGPSGERLDRLDLTKFIDGDYEVWVRPSIHGHTFTTALGWTPRRVPKADIGKTGYVFTAEEFEEHRDYIEEVCGESYIHGDSGRKWIPRVFDGDDFVQLLAWFITEGNVYTSTEKWFGSQFRGSSTSVKIAQEATVLPDGGSRNHTLIGELLDRMGFDYYVNDRAYQFTSKLLGELMTTLCGGTGSERQIPSLIWGLEKEQKRLFLDTLIAGDGDWQTNAWRYTTSSQRLRDDVLKLCAHLGLTASYNRDSGSWRIYVTESTKNTLRMNRSSYRSTAENGVHCVTVKDNHTLLAGRNGKFQFVGQSLYGVSGWERFRLYDKESAAAVTATGREVIRFTETAANELGYEVMYGDTDSVMLEFGHELSKSEAIERSFEIADHINSRYDVLASEVLGAEEHRFQIEFEKLYRRFFQASRKKRYAGHIIWKEGKDVDDIDITGFEYKRSDIAPITKEVQRTVLEQIVHGERPADIEAYVRKIVEEFKAGQFDLDTVGIPGGIGKRLDDYDTNTAHVRGANYANAIVGTNFQRGSKPKRLYLERVHPVFFERVEQERSGLLDNMDYREFKRDPDVICFEYPDELPDAGFVVDWDVMLDKTLEGPIARIFEALEISWEKVVDGGEQHGLDQYM